MNNYHFLRLFITIYILFSFTTASAQAPTATTGAATSVTSTGATLNGTVNANGFQTVVTFEYGLDTGYGNTIPADQSPISGSTDTPVSASISELSANTTYHYRVTATNVNGTTYGSDMTFTTLPNPPTAITGAATGVTSTGATLNGTVNANGSSTTVTFEYGLDTNYGSIVTADQSPVTGSTNTAVSKALTGLTQNTTYHYRVVATNVGGTTYGSNMTFTTLLDPPTATTGAATSISSTGATLNGTVNANGSSTTVTFEYGLDTNYGSTATADQSPVTGSTNTAVSKALTGLTSNTLYHYRVTATNAGGTTNGLDMTFTTLPDPPTATTGAATGVTSTGATLNGTVNANNALTVVTFEYGLDTGYGSTAAADQSPVTGSTSTAVSKAITGLASNTLYHYRVTATNAGGTTNGSDMTFTTSIPVTFTDGSGFTPTITPGSSNQAIGRFRLTGSFSGTSLTASTIRLNGTRTGLSNLKLWSSTDASFNPGSDTQLGSTVATDPGDGNSVSFSSFSSAISTSGTYLFLTGDVAVGATGTVQGVIVQNSSLALSSNGDLVSSISNEILSGSDIPLPVGLVSFFAHAEGRSIILNWITESEVENLGFILERSIEISEWVEIASYQTHEALKGQGNTTSRTEYRYTDVTVESGKSYYYRLSDVSTRGEITVHPPLYIKMDALPEVTEMENAYPNPFNPRIYISYHISEDTWVKISVLDIRGRLVADIYNGRQEVGSYHVFWNGLNGNGVKVSSGIYIILMRTENVIQFQKVVLMK